MTYKESYMQCNTEEEILSSMKADIEVAMYIGSNDRIAYIKKAGEEAINEKFGGNEK